MNWKRVATYVLFLVVVPQVIGIAFGIGSVLFESTVWARQTTIAIAMGVIYARLAFVQPVRWCAHVYSVFAIAELDDHVLTVPEAVPVVVGNARKVVDAHEAVPVAVVGGTALGDRKLAGVEGHLADQVPLVPENAAVEHRAHHVGTSGGDLRANSMAP